MIFSGLFIKYKVIMENKGILTRVMVLLALVLVMAACSDEIVLEPQGVSGPLIGVEGGTVTGFNGQVVMTIPAGAISKSTQFIIHDIQKQCKSGLNEGEMFRAFVIEPHVSFKVPAEITVKCQGGLSEGNELSNMMAVSFYVWDKLQDYYSQSEPCISCCCVDLSSQCITGCIGATGVILTMAEMGHN